MNYPIEQAQSQIRDLPTDAVSEVILDGMLARENKNVAFTTRQLLAMREQVARVEMLRRIKTNRGN